MTFPTKAIDRLFDRLELTYGSQWTNLWKDSPIADVKTAWCYELQSFDPRLDAVAWALENLPDRVPNLIAFRNLCRSAPAKEVLILPEPKADPARLKAELSKLGEIRSKVLVTSTIDGRDWARRILQRQKDECVLSPISIRFAKEALRA